MGAPGLDESDYRHIRSRVDERDEYHDDGGNDGGDDGSENGARASACLSCPRTAGGAHAARDFSEQGKLRVSSGCCVSAMV